VSELLSNLYNQNSQPILGLVSPSVSLNHPAYGTPQEGISFTPAEKSCNKIRLNQRLRSIRVIRIPFYHLSNLQTFDFMTSSLLLIFL